MMNNLFPQNQNQPGIDKKKLQQWLPQINNNMIQQLVAQARQCGISEKDIQDGLNFLKQLRSSG